MIKLRFRLEWERKVSFHGREDLVNGLLEYAKIANVKEPDVHPGIRSSPFEPTASAGESCQESLLLIIHHRSLRSNPTLPIAHWTSNHDR